MVSSRWAILKCKFADDESDLAPDEYYERLFTGAGIGSLNMVDFFRDMSHGRLDLSESQVFGWFTVPNSHTEYPIRVRDNMDAARGWLYNLCYSAAIRGGVEVHRFDGVLVAMNRGSHVYGTDGIDLWGGLGGMHAFTDRYGLTPSLMGQEMAHGYGLDHSRMEGSEEDYRDRWDTMSTMRAFMAPSIEYGLVGPGLNAVNMMLMGWFDESRLWRRTRCGFDETVRLRPLHRHDLPGHLAASFPDPRQLDRQLILAFRVKKRWDANVRRSAVLLHREEGRHSYIIPIGWAGTEELGEAETFEYAPGGPGSPRLRIEVLDIDVDDETCDLRVQLACPDFTPDLKGVAARHSRLVIGGVPYDGGGGVILPEGQIVPIGPWDPSFPLLRSLAGLHTADLIADPSVQLAVRRAALTQIIHLAQAQLDGISAYRSPAPATEPIQGAEPPGCLAGLF